MTAVADKQGAQPTVPSAALAGRGGLGLRGLILAVIVAALAIGSTAMALASLAAFQRTLLQTVDSRLSEVASEIARNVENGLQAGVALPQQRRLLAVMAAERAQAPDISAIRLIDDRGRILFATNEAEIGEQVTGTDLPPERHADAPGDTEARAWRHIGPHRIVLGLPLVGLFGEPLGTVTVALPKDAFTAQNDRFALSLALVAAAITVGGGLATALLLAVARLPTHQRIERLQGRLLALYDVAGLRIGDGVKPELPEAPTTTGALALPNGLAAPMARFETWLGKRLHRLAEHEAEVRRLDETA